MNQDKYFAICRHCGTPILKTTDPFLAKLEVECPGCEKLAMMPAGVALFPEKQWNEEKKIRENKQKG